MSGDDAVTQHSLEAEKAVLGAVLVAEQNWTPVSSLLRETDFYRAAHARVFAAMSRLSDRGVGLDPLLLVEELRRAGDLDEVGGPAYLFSLTDAVPRTANVAHYASVVSAKARWRAIGSVALRLQEQATAETGAPEQVISEVAQSLLALVESPVLGLSSAQEIAARYVEGLVSGSPRESFETGRVAVDGLASIARRGELTYLACRASTGATAFALEMAARVAGERKPVLYVSSRLSKRLLAARLLAWKSGVSSEAIETGRANQEQYAKVASAMETLNGEDPLFFETGSRTVAEVLAWCRRVKSDNGLACVFVDPLHGLLADGFKRRDREEEYTQLARTLKREAERLDVAVVALVRVDRAPESRSDKRPHLSELRAFGAEEADVVALLFREELHRKLRRNEGVAEFIFVKNRGGQTGVVRLRFDKELGKFEDTLLTG